MMIAWIPHYIEKLILDENVRSKYIHKTYLTVGIQQF